MRRVSFVASDDSPPPSSFEQRQFCRRPRTVSCRYGKRASPVSPETRLKAGFQHGKFRATTYRLAGAIENCAPPVPISHKTPPEFAECQWMRSEQKCANFSGMKMAFFGLRQTSTIRTAGARRRNDAACVSARAPGLSGARQRTYIRLVVAHSAGSRDR